MQIFATLVGKTDIACGTSANGDWERQTLIFQTTDENLTTLPVEVFGKKKVKEVQSLQIGTLCNVSFKIEGNEKDGRWFVRLVYYHITPYQLAQKGGNDV